MSQTTNTTRNFLRHYGEMVLAMYAGMLGLGALLGSTTREGAPELFALVMALNMTVPMLLWMWHRGHSWPVVIETVAVMAGCALMAMLLVWLSVIDATAICAIECALMLAAMLGAMLLRRGEWTAKRRPARLEAPADRRGQRALRAAAARETRAQLGAVRSLPIVQRKLPTSAASVGGKGRGDACRPEPPQEES